MGQTQGAGALGVAVFDGGHHLAVLLLVLQAPLRREAAALEGAPFALRPHVVHQPVDAGDEDVVRCLGQRLVQLAVPVLEVFQRGGGLGLNVAVVHAGKVGAAGVADHQFDQRRLQHHARGHQLGRADGLHFSDARARLQQGQRGVGLGADVGAAAHGLGDQPLALEVLQHPPHGGARQAEFDAECALGRDAVAGAPLAGAQVLDNRFSQHRAGVHGQALG